jgi:aconitate hydratase
LNRFINSFVFAENTYYYCDLKKVFEKYPLLKKLPNSLKIFLETNIRNAKEEEIENIIDVFISKNNLKEIKFYPSRVIVEDFNAISTLVDLASIRDTLVKKEEDAKSINPKIMFDLVINNSKDMEKNKERYEFIKWCSNEFENFSLIPPNIEKLPLINLEYLSTMINLTSIENKNYLYPETIITIDSSMNTINALGVLGLKVDEIEMEAALFGSTISLNFPKVIGIEILGSISQGVSIDDIVFSLGNILKEHKTKGKIVEFYGSGLKNITVEDRIDLSKFDSKFEIICGYFGIDENTISYVEKTRGVDASFIKEYFTKQEIYNTSVLDYDEYLELDLSLVKPIVSGPKRVENKFPINQIQSKLQNFKKGHFINDNDIVLANISSGNKILNPTLLIQAGLLAKKAYEMGLSINTNIKKLLTINSYIELEYLKRLDLLKYLEKLGFYLLDSEILVERVSLDIDKFMLDVSSVSSSYKNFEEKIDSKIKSNWQMSPALVIAYSIKGNMNFDITKDSLSQDIYLSDIWPSMIEVNEYLAKIDFTMYQDLYKNIYKGNKSWQELKYEKGITYNWDENSTYIQPSEFYDDINYEKIEIIDAKILALLGNDISSEYISPLGHIVSYTASAQYLKSKGLHPDEFDSYESRRGNSEFMTTATLSNIKLKNKILPEKEGGYTKDFEKDEIVSIYDFSKRMKEQNTPLVIFAGSQYGIGERSYWSAKAIASLGVKAIIAKNFDKKHRIDLIKMGVLPLEFIDDDIDYLRLKGDEIISIKLDEITLKEELDIEIKKDEQIRNITVNCRLDTKAEVEFYKNGGELAYLLKNK